MSNPTIVLVPGAWHQPAHYSVLIRLLEGAGYKVVTEKLPGVDSSTPTQESTANDAAFIKKQLLDPLVDEGIDILLLMHSYGGCPGAAAAKGYSKKERTAAGKKGGIIGLVFMVAFLANEGDSLLSKLPNQEYDPWVVWNVSAYTHVPRIRFRGDGTLTPAAEGNITAPRFQPQERLLQRSQRGRRQGRHLATQASGGASSVVSERSAGLV
jgi:pimeloyl-ACP methyl ester carboxylesterase